MPIGFPSSPTVGQEYPTVSPKWVWDGVKWVAIANPLTGFTPVTARLASITNTDDFLALRVVSGQLETFLVSASVMQTYMGGTPAATEPSAFTDTMWSATATATSGEISFNIISLPSDGGSAITSLEYRVGTGSAIAFTGTGTGVRVVTAGLTAGVAADLQVRAVNAVGASAWSDIKNRTPAAAGGGTYEIAATGSSSPGYGDPRTAPVPAGAADGDRLMIVFSVSGGTAVTSVTDNQSTSYSALSIPSAGADDRVYLSEPLGASIPTTITIDLASATMVGKADVYVLTGASATVANHGTISTGWSTDPRAHAYTTTGSNEFVFGLVDFTGGGVTGADSADAAHIWNLNAGSGYLHTFATVRASAGSYSATLAPVGAGSPSEGYWFSLGAA